MNYRIFHVNTKMAVTNPATIGPIPLKYERIIHIYGIPDHLF